MGLLDDAIREHLELKRRRGADSEEVSRQEQEALGPTRRGEFAEAAPAPAAATPEEPPPEEPPAEAAPEPRDEGWLEDAPEPEPERDAEPAPQPEPEGETALDQPTVEYTPDEPPREREDVLEETPDFLQETPEHDRLWSEQKPPRDFDLDR